MDCEFEPLELSQFPPFSPNFKKANAFIGGILFNRIFFEITKANDPNLSGINGQSDLLENLIKKIEHWLSFFESLWVSDCQIMFRLMECLDGLKIRLKKKKNNQEDNPSEADSLERSLRNRLPEINSNEYRLSLFKEGKAISSSLKDKFEGASVLFELGLVVGGATKGLIESQDGLKYHEVVPVPPGTNKWEGHGLEGVKPSSKSFYSGNKHFLKYELKKFNLNVPFGILELDAGLPGPEEWARELLNIWKMLKDADRKEAGFKRVKMESGDIYLDGRHIGHMNPISHPYLGLYFIVEELKKNKNKMFTSREVYKAIYAVRPKQVKKSEKPRTNAQGRPTGTRTNALGGTERLPEFNKIYNSMSDEIKKIFKKVDNGNRREGFTLVISEDS